MTANQASLLALNVMQSVSDQQVQLFEYRGAQLAAFNAEGRGVLMCLPQVFKLFQKHLVGGLHTMYSAFANSCPLQTDTFLFPLIHSHKVVLSSNKF